MPTFEQPMQREESGITPTTRRKSRRHHRDDSAAAARRRRSRSASPPPSRALRGLGISYDGNDSSQDGDIDEETIDSPAPATRYVSAGPRHGSAPRGTAATSGSGSTPAAWQAAMAHRPDIEVIEWEAPTFRSRPTLPPLTSACCLRPAPRPRPFAAPSSGAAAAAPAAATSTRPPAPTSTPLRRTSEIHLRGSTFTIFLPTPSAQLRLFQALLSAAVHYSALARRRSDAAAESDRRARERWVRRGCYCGRCARCAREEEAAEVEGEGDGGEVTVEERKEMEEGAMRLGHLTSLVRRACDLDTTTVPKPSTTTTTTTTASTSIVSPLLYSTMVNWLRACLSAERDWKAALELQEDEQRRVLRASRVGRCEPREAILIVKRRQDLRALRDVALFTTDIIRLLQAEQDVLCPPPSYPQTAGSPGEASSSSSSSPASSSSSISSLDLPPSYDDVATTAAPQRAARQPRARQTALDEWLDEEHQGGTSAATPRTPRLPTCWAFEPLPRHILEG